MNPFIRYTVLRFLVFGLVLSILVAVHLRGFALVAGALLLSAAVSYLLLSGPRQVLVDRLEQRTRERAGRRRPRDADSITEDDLLDGITGSHAAPGSGAQEIGTPGSPPLEVGSGRDAALAAQRAQVGDGGGPGRGTTGRRATARSSRPARSR